VFVMERDSEHSDASSDLLSPSVSLLERVFSASFDLSSCSLGAACAATCAAYTVSASVAPLPGTGVVGPRRRPLDTRVALHATIAFQPQ
jgi:hypothetical protein